VDRSAPRATGWLEPRSGSFALTGAVPELLWRAVTDSGSGATLLQRVQRQIAPGRHGACRGVTWADDGAARDLAPHDEQWDLRSGMCYRWILHPVDRVGNVGKPAYSGWLFVDLTPPAADFLTPDEGNVVTTRRATYRVAWTERAQVGGGSTSRLLERERVRAVGDSCPVLGWVPQGASDAGSSPSRSTGLKRGWCYRWRLNLSDSRSNLATELSGVVRVVPAAP
jgi:hypothetical protein